MQGKDNEEARLIKSLRTILAKEDLNSHQELIKRISTELQISHLDCAAALSFLYKPDLYPVRQKAEKCSADVVNMVQPVINQKYKYIRYRINVGRMHKVLVDEIKAVLVDVTGVDCNTIGRLEIRNHYTLIDLPEGMPPDIFQLLSETEIHGQKLNLKRIKFQRRFQRRNNKK